MGPNTARRILAERYARGELDTEEYAYRLEDLGGQPLGTAPGEPGTGFWLGVFSDTRPGRR